MKKYVPKMYKKSVFDIDYEKLEKEKIKCLIYDLDNTILPIGEKNVDKKIVNLIQNLKKKFKVLVVSNSRKPKPKRVAETLKVEYHYFALKPLPFKFKKIKKKYNYEFNEMCIIGDQLMTDILGGNRLNMYTILVEPLSEKDRKVTSLNRFLERKKMDKMSKLGLFTKGEFYG